MAAQSTGVPMPAESSQGEPLFNAWFASWPDVRRELEAVLQAYERRHPSYDRGWIEPVFEMMDTTVYNLSYRVHWLRANVDRGEDMLPADDDDAFYAALAAEQVG